MPQRLGGLVRAYAPPLAVPTRPAVGVVIPVRNRPRSVARAIHSVFQQSVGPLRVIVVDDGSVDTTPLELRRLAGEHENLRVVTIAHSGPATARNHGLAALRATLPSTDDGTDRGHDPLIAFLDSDDVWPPDFLSRAQRRLLDEPDVGFVVGDRLEGFHASGARLHSASLFDADPWEALRRQSPRIMSCAVFRRRVLRDRPFLEGRFVGEDAALLIDLLARGTRSAWISGAPVVAMSIPPGDQDRVTTRHRSRRHQLLDRVASAEAYAAALADSTAAIPQGLGARLLAARWMAVLGHSVAACDRHGISRALAELWRCGATAALLGARDHCAVIADVRSRRASES